MSTHNVEELEDILKGLRVYVVGDSYVVQDGQTTWTGECSDVTDKVIRKVKEQEAKWRAAEPGYEPMNGYDVLCDLVDYIEDDATLAKVREAHGDVVNTL